MLSRRDVLIGAGVAGAAALVRPVITFASASQPTQPVDFQVPAGACDCHTHVFGDSQQYPFAASRVYTPEPASPSAEALALLALGKGKLLGSIVQIVIFELGGPVVGERAKALCDFPMKFQLVLHAPP